MKMMRLTLSLLACSPLLLADLTVDQKVTDFMSLAGLYAKNYAPYELKRDLYGFDLFNVQPWLSEVKASKNDVEFFDICARYVASLRDSHDGFTMRSTFDAWLHFDGDIYDGKYLIDFLDRAYLPARTYPFTTGDELVSVDGVPVAELLVKFAPYSVNGSSNLVSRRRLAAATITERYQGWYPKAIEIGKTAEIVVRRRATGEEETYTIPWDVMGDAVTTAGTVPSPMSKRTARAASAEAKPRLRRKGLEPDETGRSPLDGYFSGEGPELVADPPTPEYMKALEQLQDMRAAEGPVAFGELSGLSPFSGALPVFVNALPAGFRVRLGLLRTDLFFSGTFQLGTKTVGFIRIPDMAPASSVTALAQFSAEMQYFQQNTDGLMIDVMANGGGSLCYAQSLASMFIPGSFRGAGQELRATLQWQQAFSNSLRSAKATGAPQWVIDSYQFHLDMVKSALQSNRGRTGVVPLCGVDYPAGPYLDTRGAIVLYAKPILVLTDNFTLSAGETFTMFLQDNKRATVFGTTTDGGGGNVVSYNTGSYSEASTRMTQGLLVRLNPVAVTGFPSMPYYDGVGIEPDVVQDYMTVANFLSRGGEFVRAASAAMTDLLK